MRREKVAREHIEFLKQNKQEKQISFLVTHKTLDVNAFLANNETRPKLVEALTKLDNHYKTICDNALSIQAEAKSYKDTVDYYSEKADNYVEELKFQMSHQLYWKNKDCFFEILNHILMKTICHHKFLKLLVQFHLQIYIMRMKNPVIFLKVMLLMVFLICLRRNDSI